MKVQDWWRWTDIVHLNSTHTYVFMIYGMSSMNMNSLLYFRFENGVELPIRTWNELSVRKACIWNTNWPKETCNQSAVTLFSVKTRAHSGFRNRLLWMEYIGPTPSSIKFNQIEKWYLSHLFWWMTFHKNKLRKIRQCFGWEWLSACSPDWIWNTSKPWSNTLSAASWRIMQQQHWL